MKKIKEHNSISRKISLLLLIIMIFNIMLPNTSNAGIGISLLSKPICGLVVLLTDSVNALLANVFAFDSKVGSAMEDIKGKTGLEKLIDALDKGESLYYNYLLSPDDIFSNKVQITNANIFSDKFDKDGRFTLSDANLFGNLMKQLKTTTAGLYYIMRNLAVVILLCLLIYCGIRIVLSSNSAGEKAKWKMYLMDWLKALALVMCIHIVMIGVFYITEVVTKGLNGAITSGDTLVATIRKNFSAASPLDVTGVWIYTIMYVYVTYMTIVFLIAYFKRLFLVIVMIIIAPIMSALYAMGKTTKANFNRWFKEFVMGVFVQPYHLLIYSVLLSVPMNVMNSSETDLGILGKFSTIDAQIYALMAITMIRPIEKFTRKMFGFGETALDNVASFESGKKTIDSGVKMVTQVATDAVKIGAAVATGGASLAATGLPGIPGQGGGIPGQGGGGIPGQGGGEIPGQENSELDTQKDDDFLENAKFSRDEEGEIRRRQ